MSARARAAPSIAAVLPRILGAPALRWLALLGLCAAYIQGGLWMPNEKRWYTDPALLKEWIGNDNHPQEYQTAVVDYAQKYVTKPMPIYRVPGWSAMWQLINPALEQVWLGKQTADQTIKEVAPKVEDYFKANIVPLLK